MRSISNVVDVSNYVMLELGQPNHPYDLAKVAGPGFRVRVARDGETLTTLDDVERRLTTEDLLICDGDDVPVGLAGIMGGATSEIDDATTDVLLEMAWFHPIGIVKSSRRHKLRSEASARFEKGTDPEVIDLAMRRFAALLGAPLEDGAAVATGTLPDRPAGPCPHGPGGPAARHRPRARRGSPRCSTRSASRPPRSATTTTCEIPSWRYDSATEIDVIEEVARHHGYTALGRTLPRAATTGGLSPRQADRRRLRVAPGRVAASPRPCRCRSSRPGELARCGLPDDGITIANPLVAEQSVLRTSLLPGLVGAVAYNWSHRNHGVHLFEIGHTFNRPADRATPTCPTSGRRSAPSLAGADAAEAVHLWRFVAEALGHHRRDDRERRGGRAPPDAQRPHPRRRATSVGALGEIDPGVLEAHGIGERVAYLEVDLDALLAAAARRRHLPALQPLPEQRHRPRLRGRRRRAGLRGRGRHPRGRR